MIPLPILDTVIERFWLVSAILLSLGISMPAPYMYTLFKKIIKSEEAPTIVCSDCNEPGHRNKRNQHCRLYVRKVGTKRKIKDSPEEKKLKAAGRQQFADNNRNPLASTSGRCTSCGEPGHNSTRSKLCQNHKLTIDEKERLVLGDKREHFVRRIPLSSIVRQQYQIQLQQKITELSAHIREIVTRAQVFVNGYIIDHASQPIPSYLYSQTFWYSTCQLVMGGNITNTNPNMPPDLLDQWNEFSARHPGTIYRLNGYVGYSCALSAACKVLATTYLNHIVENFEGYLVNYCTHELQIAAARLSKTQCKAIIEKFIVPALKEETRTWPSDVVDFVSCDILSALHDIEDGLLPKVPQPCTSTKRSATPGAFIPALKYMLSQYELEHLEYSVAISLAYPKSETVEPDPSVTRTLPKLFALFPIPSMHWRFVHLNAKCIKTLLSIPGPLDNYDKNMQLFEQVFDLAKFGFNRQDFRFICSIKSDQQMFFRNTISTDGFNTDFLFSRKKREVGIKGQNLELIDFCGTEIDAFYRPCAVDPGVATLLTASYGYGSHTEIRKYSSREYYSETGSKRRNVELNKEKERTGLKQVESNFPTAKTARLEQYQDYARYFFLHKSELFAFYSHHRAEGRFYSYQGKQRALEEATNILVNGGKKYNRKQRKKKNTRRNRRTRKNNRERKKTKRKLQRRTICRSDVINLPRHSVSSTRSTLAKPKMSVDNGGKMPLVVFGNGMFQDSLTFKRHMSHAVKKIFNNLKRREKAGQVVVVTIDEYLTSQICHHCQERALEKWKAPDGRRLHGILRCKKCGILWNRDVNAAKNMMQIASFTWSGEGRPNPFRRPGPNITTANVGSS